MFCTPFFFLSSFWLRDYVLPFAKQPESSTQICRASAGKSAQCEYRCSKAIVTMFIGKMVVMVVVAMVSVTVTYLVVMA